MDILKYKDYEGTAELDMTRNTCRGKVLFIDDLVTYESSSPANLQKEFEEAVDDYLDTCAQLEKEAQRPFRGQFNVRVSPTLHRAAAIRAAADAVSLNDVVVRALDAFLNCRADVNHNIRVTLESSEGSLSTLTAVANENPKWGVAHVH
ncbi:type II toxin-antitoxin system HicB family antitoxin [Roseateles albus]|uniref:Type II toxin-antitoxin system HicB family antitoxin n=1 Tax=Roseateles albus TaxID=2987525 RepID=A0ABT5KHQ0_9BURK|nr:type II toxin-antitoxin system HicB family antitoxin [Roseateles albus]